MDVTLRADRTIFDKPTIIFDNLEGRETAYEPAGRRSFAISLTEGVLTDLLELEGWRVKRNRNGDVVCLPVRIEKDDTRVFTKEMIENSSQVIIRAYHWTFQGKSGITAMLDDVQ